MPQLNLSPDELLSTTRSVRKRLDFTRPVEPAVIRECLELALQAPNGGNRQPWHFVVVTDQDQRNRLGEIYRKGWDVYLNLPVNQKLPRDSQAIENLRRIRSSSDYLAEHMQDAPVLLIPCLFGRLEDQPVFAQAGAWGSILPATWSFMLAARERGLGTCMTTVHLFFEQDAAEVLGIPYERITQVAMIPVAYTKGTDFKPAPRQPLDPVVHWNQW